MPDEAAVGLDLRLTRTPQTDASAGLLEVRPHSGQTGEHVLELRQLHLHLRLARPRPRREDVQDELRAIHHPRAELELDVLPLRRRQLVVEDHQRRPDVGHAVAQFLELSLSEIGRRARPIQELRDLADDLGARRVGEARQLFQMLGQEMSRRRPLQRSADEDGALRGRRERDDFSSDGDP